MKYALISTTERIYIDNVDVGARVAETAQVPFEVYETLFWVECADEVEQDKYYYDQVTNEIKIIPPPTINVEQVNAGEVVY